MKLYKVQGTDRKGNYYESRECATPGEARAIARRKGGTYEILTQFNNAHLGSRWSGGECGSFA